MTIYRVYKILSGEEWNGQTSYRDFKETKYIGDAENLEDYYENWQDEDTILDIVETW